MAIDKIDVVTTATMRPELLKLTYQSFRSRLFSQIGHCRLIINIDPLPSANEAALESVLKICHEWFPEVVYRYPSVPSFPAAVQWVWSQVNSDICFHLEDDWLLLKPIDVQRVENYFMAEPHLAEITLNPSRNKVGNVGLALRPSFIRREFIRAALPMFDLALDPEKQWRRHIAPGGVMDTWSFRHYGDVGEGRYIKDMGAVWRAAHDFTKWGSGEVSWRSGNTSYLGQRFKQLRYDVYMGVWSRLGGWRK